MLTGFSHWIEVNVFKSLGGISIVNFMGNNGVVYGKDPICILDFEKYVLNKLQNEGILCDSDMNSFATKVFDKKNVSSEEKKVLDNTFEKLVTYGCVRIDERVTCGGLINKEIHEMHVISSQGVLYLRNHPEIAMNDTCPEIFAPVCKNP